MEAAKIALSRYPDLIGISIGEAYEVREVQVVRQGRGLVITPVRPSWSIFFNSKVKVPDDFLAPREDDPPQEREPL